MKHDKVIIIRNCVFTTIFVGLLCVSSVLIAHAQSGGLSTDYSNYTAGSTVNLLSTISYSQFTAGKLSLYNTVTGQQLCYMQAQNDGFSLQLVNSPGGQGCNSLIGETAPGYFNGGFDTTMDGSYAILAIYNGAVICWNQASPQNYATCQAQSFAEVDFTISGSISPQISFVSPTSSTPLFNNFALHASGLNASGSYEANVSYYATLPNGQTTQVFSTPFTGNFNNSAPDWYITSGVFNLGTDYPNNIQITATANLYSSQDPNNPNADLITPLLIASSQETFTLLSVPNSAGSSTQGGIYNIITINSSGTLEISTTTGNIGIGLLYPNGSGGNSSWCSAYASSTLEYSGCQIIDFLFNPNIFPQSVTLLQSALSQIKGVPPFSIYFDLANAVQSGAQNFGNDSSTLNGVTISILGYPSQQEVQLVNVNSTTYFGGFGANAGNASTTEQSQSASSNLEHYIGAWIWIAAGIKVIYIIAG